MSSNGEPVKIEFDIVETMLLNKKGTHPNVQVVVENWGKKIPKARMFDLRFWGEEGEPGYAIRFNRDTMERFALMICSALQRPHTPVPKRPWWNFWTRP
jgi:hypothetical protein